MPEAMKAAGTGDFWSTLGMLCLQVESLCFFFFSFFPKEYSQAMPSSKEVSCLPAGQIYYSQPISELYD